MSSSWTACRRALRAPCVWFLLLAAGSAPSAVQAAPLRPDHPLLGTWRIDLPDGTCHEVYRIYRNGTSLVTSAAEVSQSRFEISDQPSERGYYRWEDRIVKDNGQPDCQGQVMVPDHSAINYILMHPDGDQFLMCGDEGLNNCIGPFVRLRGVDA